MNQMRFAIALVLLLAACGAETSAESGELRPAAEVIQEQASDGAIAGEFGQSYELNDGVVVTVNSIESKGVTKRAVNVRVENPTGQDAYTPMMAVYCSNVEEPGDYWSESTIGIGDDLPAGSFREGVLEVSKPNGNCDDPVFRILGGDGIFIADDPVTIEFAY